MNAATTSDGQGADDLSEATLHATCVVLDEAGILIRGEPGGGKSSLALALLDRTGRRGRHASLVCDDRIRIMRTSGRLVARPLPSLAWLIEIRGLGILRAAQRMDATVIRLVVDLVEQGVRLPEASPATCDILGVALPRLALDRAFLDHFQQAALIDDSLAVQRIGVAGLTHPPILAWGDPPDV